METVMRYRGKAVTDEEVVFIREFIAQNSGDSRWMLSRKLCQAWDWRQPNGALRDMVCRGLMLHLARAGQIELPPIRIRIVNPLVHRKKPARVEIDRTPMEGKLSDLGPLAFRQGRRTGEEGLVVGSPSYRRSRSVYRLDETDAGEEPLSDCLQHPVSHSALGKGFMPSLSHPGENGKNPVQRLGDTLPSSSPLS